MNGLRFQVAETNSQIFANEEESPFTRLQARGAGALSTTELLSLFVTPKRGETSEETARKLWDKAGSLRALLKDDAKELMNMGARRAHGRRAHGGLTLPLRPFRRICEALMEL